MRLLVGLARILLATTALLPLAPPADAGPSQGGVAQIPAGGVRVAEVTVRGNQQIAAQAILAGLRTRPGAVVTRADIEADVEQIRRLGFFQFVGPPEVQMTPTGARVTFVVQEFPRISDVRFVGSTVFTETELRRLLGVERGQLAEREAIRRGFQNIEAAYRARGYVARVADQVDISPAGILTVTIQEVRVGDIDIVGLQRVRRDVVERALSLHPGDLFSERALRQDFVRLQQFGLFESIEPEVQITAAGEALITWNVKETRTRAINFGLSYSPTESLVGNISFVESNFRGRAEQLRVTLNLGSLEGQVGGEVAYAAPLLADRIAYNARLFSLVEYRFAETVLIAATQDLGRYHERHSGVQLGGTRALGRGRALSLSGRFEDVRVFNLPPEFLAPGTPSLSSSLLGARGEMSWDRRDSILYPTTGTYALANAEIALVGRGSEGEGGMLLRPQADWRVFRPWRLGARTPGNEPNRVRVPVLAVRILAGSAIGTMPFFEQYFVGGASTLRGYPEGRFWGDSMFLVNAELRWPIGSGIIGAAFIDVGHAWGSEFQFADIAGFETRFRQSRDPALRFGVGAGVRYLTPIAPLRLDFAYGDKLRVHFTLGEAF